VIVLLGFLLIASAIRADAAADASATSTPLLETRWGQTGEYATFCPAHERAGCWSTAIAQILYFHRLLPSGDVAYRCTSGYSIRENLDAYAFNWDLFVNRIDGTTQKASVDEVARYVYFTSIVIQKDFGTGNYVLGHSERAAEVARHYRAEAQLYTNEQYSTRQIKDIIVREIAARRPVMLHLRDVSRATFHAVVIDACRTAAGQFEVHINMGYEREEDGWYAFDRPIDQFDDNAYRRIMTIRPLSS
jgi:hypothetical protein